MPPTVLCVQKDRALCAHYQEVLEAEGFEVLRANDGSQTLDVLKRHTPDFVVLDIELPRQDGFEILADLRAQNSACAAAVLMACDGDVTADLEERATLLGATGVVSSPIDALELVARVRAAVKPEVQAPSKRTRSETTGSLKSTHFPELMQRLYRQKLDGVVLVEHGKKKKAVEFREGWPVCVKSNLLSECLGGYLVRTGACQQNEVDESVKRMKTGEGLQGEILVAMDVLDEEHVVQALQGHALEKLFEIFAWPDGKFRVRPGVRIQRGSSIALVGHPADLIVSGIRTVTPLKWIDRFFEQNAKQVLSPIAEHAGVINSVDLAAAEADWIEGLDDSVPLAKIAALPESTRRLTFALILIEFFRVEGAAVHAELGRKRVRSVRVDRSGVKVAGNAGDDAMREELASMANAMQGADHYGVLGIDSSTSDEEVMRAYEQKCRRAHPDLFHGASSSVRQLSSQVFARLSEAREALRDEESRLAYDAQVVAERSAPTIEHEGRRALQAETEFQKGERLMLERDYESALVCFGRAMENFPSEGEYRSHYGWCLYLCHSDSAVMLGEALEHCREGLKLAKDREKPYLLLGRLYKNMGKPGAAKKMFTRAVQIKPQCVEAMRELRIMNMRRDKDRGMLGRLLRR